MQRKGWSVQTRPLELFLIKLQSLILFQIWVKLSVRLFSCMTANQQDLQSHPTLRLYEFQAQVSHQHIATLQTTLPAVLILPKSKLSIRISLPKMVNLSSLKLLLMRHLEHSMLLSRWAETTIWHIKRRLHSVLPFWLPSWRNWNSVSRLLQLRSTMRQNWPAIKWNSISLG